VNEKHETYDNQGQGYSMKIAFIGGGIMATALIGGMYAAHDEIEKIQVADPGPEVKKRLESQWPITCFSTAIDAIKGMDTIVLAVKPQVLPVVLDEIGDLVNPGQLIISIVAGIPVSQIAGQLTASPPIVRTMPNTPALIGLGITGMYASDCCNPGQRRMAEKLMQVGGETVWLEEEKLLDVVTAVSGSGPAYFYYMIEAIQNAGTRLGLPEDIAGKLALHTANGAGSMALHQDVDVAELRRRVTTKGGTTEAALEQFKAGHFKQLVDLAITAATHRGQELADDVGQAGGKQI